MTSFVMQPEVGNSVRRSFQRCLGEWREKMTSPGVSVCLSYAPEASKGFRLHPLCVWWVFAGKVSALPPHWHKDLASEELYFFIFCVKIWGKYRS